jgi:hypothetical protein
MKAYNDGIDIKRLIDELPAGLDRATLRVLSSHIGRELAISRVELVTDVGLLGFKVHERAERAQINQLRKQGYPICSTGGEGGGYFMARDWDELEEYIEREVHARAMDLLEQEQALKSQAEKTWGRYSPDKQARMF